MRLIPTATIAAFISEISGLLVKIGNDRFQLLATDTSFLLYENCSAGQLLNRTPEYHLHHE